MSRTFNVFMTEDRIWQNFVADHETNKGKKIGALFLQLFFPLLQSKLGLCFLIGYALPH